MKLPCVAFLLVIVGAASAEDAFVNEMIRDALHFLNECGSNDLSVCLKEKALRYLELLPSNFEIGGIIKVKQNEEGPIKRQNRFASFISEFKGAEARENALDNIIMKRLIDFLGTHTIEFKIPKQAIYDIKRSLEEEGRKKKKKGGNQGLILLFCLKLAALAALALKALAVLSFKALIIGKIALTISGVIALKKLFDQKRTSTYEVITHPHYEEHGRSDTSTYGHDLAYRGQDDVKSFSNERF